MWDALVSSVIQSKKINNDILLNTPVQNILNPSSEPFIKVYVLSNKKIIMNYNSK